MSSKWRDRGAALVVGLLCADPAQAASAAEAGQPKASAAEVAKTVLGLVAILALAYLGGHPRVQELERKLRVSQVITAGFAFVLLGFVAHRPAIGILSEDTLRDIRPILPLGLGWIGFAVGFRFDASIVQRAPAGIATAVLLTTAIPFLLLMGGALVVFALVTGSLPDADVLRDSLIVGAAGATSSRTTALLLAGRGASLRSVRRVAQLLELEQLAAVVGLLVVAAYFRPPDESVAWQLPGTAWLFITVGLATALGATVYGVLATARGGTDFLVLLLGSISFAAGMASYLRLSPVVICFLAGVILVNFPSPWKGQVRSALTVLERPIYLLFLVIAGALWDPDAWQGWALAATFVATRLAGKWLGVRGAEKTLGMDRSEQTSLVVSPIGAVAIAIVMSAQDLYSGQTIGWIVTAVIGGSIAVEFVVQVVHRSPAAALPPESGVMDV